MLGVVEAIRAVLSNGGSEVFVKITEVRNIMLLVLSLLLLFFFLARGSLKGLFVFVAVAAVISGGNFTVGRTLTPSDFDGAGRVVLVTGGNAGEKNAIPFPLFYKL